MKTIIFTLIILFNYYSYAQKNTAIIPTPKLATQGVSIISQSEKSALVNGTTKVIAILKKEELPQPRLVESEMTIIKSYNEELNPQTTKQDIIKPEFKTHSKTTKKNNKR